jgi:hypothetical protein
MTNKFNYQYYTKYNTGIILGTFGSWVATNPLSCQLSTLLPLISHNSNLDSRDNLRYSLDTVLVR